MISSSSESSAISLESVQSVLYDMSVFGVESGCCRDRRTLFFLRKLSVPISLTETLAPATVFARRHVRLQ
jgi:hypothetical protein